MRPDNLTVGYLLDTSVVGRIRDGAATADRWSPIFVPDIVLLELSRTPDAALRHELLDLLLKRLGPSGILRGEQPEAAYYTGIDDFDIPYDSPALSLGRLFPLITRAIGSNFQSHRRDGLIAQAALMHGLSLITVDKKQARAARRFGVPVEYIH